VEQEDFFPLFLDENMDITGIDVSEKMLEIARKKFPKIECVAGDGNNLPFKDESFEFFYFVRHCHKFN